MALPEPLQQPFEQVFGDLIRIAVEAASREGKGADEVGWLKQFQLAAKERLAQDLRQAMRSAGVMDSVFAHSAFIHGNPFQIEPVEPLTRGVEAGDLLLVGERYEEDAVVERQALLLQMKVGPADLNEVSTLQQALLYGTWPKILWRTRALRELPGPHPREPRRGPCQAAQFGLLPKAPGGRAATARRLAGPGVFDTGKSDLAQEMAAVARLDIGVNATPGPTDGWSRIVQDMLDRSLEREYGKRLPFHVHAIDPVDEPDAEGGFLVVIVATGPMGRLD